MRSPPCLSGAPNVNFVIGFVIGFAYWICAFALKPFFNLATAWCLAGRPVSAPDAAYTVALENNWHRSAREAE